MNHHRMRNRLGGGSGEIESSLSDVVVVVPSHVHTISELIKVYTFE